jgi:hypothetical protein
MVDLKRIAQVWNAAIQLKAPDLGTLQGITGVEATQVYEGFNEVLCGGSNLLIGISPALAFRPLEKSTRVLSVGVVTRSTFLAPHATVAPVDLGTFRLMKAAVPCSATEMAAHLRAESAGELVLVTEPGQWLIHYGGSVSLTFWPRERAETRQEPGNKEGDPADSTLVRVEFFYSIPFGGRISASIETE